MGVCPLLSRDTAESEKSLQVRTYVPGERSLFTSVQIYRKCLASTYHGWGLQSLVSEKERRERKTERRRGKRETQSSECAVVCFVFLLSLLTFSLIYDCFVHTTAESTSELASLQRCVGLAGPGLRAARLLCFVSDTVQTSALALAVWGDPPSAPHPNPIPTTPPHPDSHHRCFSVP